MELITIIEDTSRLIKDSGPIYHEFHPNDFIKEPWNAFSSLFFLVPVAYWIWRLRGEFRENLIITALLPLLFLNGVGSTLYHAFRASNLFLMLDWMPAFIMNLILSGYMWHKIVHSHWKSAGLVVLFYVLAIASIRLLQPIMGFGAANIGYLFIGLCLLIPTILFLIRTRFYKWQLITLSFVFLGMALLFRSLDYPTPNPFPGLLPQGTHFLWHITSALAVFTLGYYLYFIKNIDIRKPETIGYQTG